MHAWERMGKLTSTQSADTGNEVDALAAKTLGVLGDCTEGGSGRRVTERGFAPANFESCQYLLLLRHLFRQGWMIAHAGCVQTGTYFARGNGLRRELRRHSRGDSSLDEENKVSVT